MTYSRCSFFMEGCVHYSPLGRGGGWVLRILSDRDDRMGANISTHKNPWGFKQNPPKSLDQNLTLQKSHAEFPSHKHVKKALNYITRIFETSVLNTQKIPTSKKNFPTQNIISRSKIVNQKISFDHPCLLKSRVPPALPPAGLFPFLDLLLVEPVPGSQIVYIVGTY